MLEYAAELVKHKELPANALGEIIHDLERYFPELTATLGGQGAKASHALMAALNLKEAEANTKTALKRIDEVFGTSALTVGEALKATEFAVVHSTGTQKQMFESLEGSLRKRLDQEVYAAKEAAKAQIQALHDVQLGVEAGTTSWGSYEQAVNKWAKELPTRVQDGAETMEQGIAAINKMLEGELTALGAPKSVGQALVTGKMPTAKQFFKEGLAGGGLMQIGQPGEAGHDTVPLNVAGLPIAVAPGEQVAVFNRHQLPIVNAALAGMGGLPACSRR